MELGLILSSLKLDRVDNSDWRVCERAAALRPISQLPVRKFPERKSRLSFSGRIVFQKPPCCDCTRQRESSRTREARCRQSFNEASSSSVMA